MLRRRLLRLSVLAVVGDLVEDVVVWPDGPLERGTDTPARISRSRGGSAANVAVAAAPDVPTRFLGCVGADPLGERLTGELADGGVDVRVQRRGRTGTVVVLVDVDGERTFLADRAAAAQLETVDPGELDDVTVLHVPAYGLDGGSTAAAVRELLVVARGRRIAVSLDASSTAVLRSIGLEDYLALVRHLRPAVLFANADEARELQLGRTALGGVTVVLKDGAEPTTVLRPDGTALRIPVDAVADVRDSTGAGDAFAAGWLTARMQGRDEAGCVLRAHELARQVLSRPGAGSQLEELR